MVKHTFLLIILATFSLYLQAQQQKRAGYPLEEVTSEWSSKGFELFEDFDSINNRICYFIDTKYAGMYYYLENDLVTSYFIWPTYHEALDAFINLYNEHCETHGDYQWKIKVDDKATFITLREDEGEYYIEFFFTIDCSGIVTRSTL